MSQEFSRGDLLGWRGLALAALLACFAPVPVEAGSSNSNGARSSSSSSCIEQASDVLAAMAKLPRPIEQPKFQELERKILAIIDQCKAEQGLVASEIALLSKMRDALVVGQNIEVCKAKVERLRSLRAKGVEHKPEPLFVNQLRIWRAVFGDLENEMKAQRSARYTKDGQIIRSPRYDDRAFNEQNRLEHVDDAGDQRRSRRQESEDEGEGEGENKRLPRTFYHSCDATWFFVNNCHGDRSSGDANTLPKATGSAQTTPDSTYCIVARKASPANDICGYDPSPEGVKSIAVAYGCANKSGGWNHRTAIVTADTMKIHLVCQYPEPPEVVKLKPVTNWEAYLVSEPCSIDPELLKACKANSALPQCKKLVEGGVL